MPKDFDEGLDYSNFYYKNYRGKDNKPPDNRYYVSVRSGDGESIKLSALDPDEIDNVPYKPIHTVEYITECSNSREDNKTKRHKNKRKYPWRSRGLAIAIMTIIICFISVILIADSLAGGYILDDLQATITGKNAKSHTYFAIEMINYTDMNSARLYSQELRAIGGAGYVVNDTLYRVIAEVFDNKTDADKVCSKLNTSGYMARIYEITIGEIDYKILPTSVRNITKKVMNYVASTNAKLYDIGAKLASDAADRNKAISDLKALRASISAELIDYESNCDNQIDNDYVYKIRAQLGMALSSIDNLCNSGDKVTGLLADIRYTNVMILNTHRALCKDIQSKDKVVKTSRIINNSYRYCQ